MMARREIEQDLARTRAEMDATIDAIAAQLAPGPLAAQLAESLRDGVLKDYARSTRQALRRNPLPAVLMLAGAGWLVYEVLRTRR